MAVQVWIGEKPEHPNERRAIVALANGLERLDGLYLILANFSVGGRNVDLVLVKSDAIFIVELKHCDGKIFGDVNGPWFVESTNGERKRLNPGRKNPYNQVISYYYSLINFLNEHRTGFLSPQKATSVDFRTCRRLVVIAPTLQPGSHVETDWKVELKGLDELPSYLVIERSSEIDLSEEEMLAIPKLLHCTRWNEINALLEGVLPRWDTQPTDLSHAPHPQAAAAQARSLHPLFSSMTGVWVRAQRMLVTRAGRLAIALAVLVLVFVLLLVFRPNPVPPPIYQPSEVVVVGTSPPAGGVGQEYLEEVSCIWTGFQPVGRRQGSQPATWENVGVSGAAPALAPDVIVTLEQVNFCDGQIAITWSVRNNMADGDVVMPLTRDNIGVRDSLGNEYTIAEAQSRPAVIRVASGSKAQGTAVIPRPAHLNAPTLVIRLERQPFGETIWLVPISTTTR